MNQIDVNGVTVNRAEARAALTVLRRGLKLLQTRGWCQGSEHDMETDTFCAFGAIRESAKGLKLSKQRRMNATILLGAQAPDGLDRSYQTPYDNMLGRVINFNDSIATHRGQVTGLFRRAISRTLAALGA